MTDLDRKRKTDNEGVFRKYNEAVTGGLENLMRVAEQEGWSNEVTESDSPLHFFCECSREDCHERIRVKPATYADIHQNRKRFTIKCDHETPEVEKVVRHGEDFCVVEKFAYPDTSVDTLKKTEK